MVSSITCASEAASGSGLSVCSSSMALMPNGVAALPSPKTLAAMLSAIMPSAGWSGGTSGKSGRRNGRTRRTSAVTMPASSAMRVSPRKSTSTPMRPSASVAAVSAKSRAAAEMAVSFTKRTGAKASVPEARRPPGPSASPSRRPWSVLSRGFVASRTTSSGAGSVASASSRRSS